MMVKVILFTAAMLFMVGCSDDAAKKASVETTSKQEVKEEVKDTASEVKEEIKDVAAEVKEEVKDAVSDVKEEVKDAASNVKEETVAVVEGAKNVVEEKTAEVQEAIATATTVDAASLYKVCAGCHGIDGSKAALNKSQIIKGWDAKKIADALHGYKAGTYGGTMKGLMGAQVSKLGDAEIEALSTYISKF